MGCILGVTAPLLSVVGLALAGWITIWAIYAWAARDAAWIASYGAATLSALLLPVALLVVHDHWQARRGLNTSASSRATEILNWARGSIALILGVLACPFILLSAYFAWMFWSNGLPAATVYFAFVGFAMLAEPVAFLLFYDRWQTRNGVQSGGVAPGSP